MSGKIIPMRINVTPEKELTRLDVGGLSVQGVYGARSESEPGIVHLVVAWSTGLVTCTCRSGQIRQKCWHIDKVEENK